MVITLTASSNMAWKRESDRGGPFLPAVPMIATRGMSEGVSEGWDDAGAGLQSEKGAVGNAAVLEKARSEKYLWRHSAKR